jgi:UDP-GlcNAc:undecaprenyl-phosphate GlcNAc-1-phosphate transferase
LSQWLAVLVAMIAGLGGSFTVRAFARRFGIVNHPNPIVPQHTVATPYLGGVGVLVGIAAGISVVVSTGNAWPGTTFVTPAVLYCALGVYDDVRPLNPLPKLAAQIAVAAVAVALGLRLSLSGHDSLDAALALVWIVACVNAFNVTDVCDGLVAGLAAIFFLGWMLMGPSGTVFAAAALGACLGFLPFNLPRASMFLGDAGSHLLGFLVAALALSGPSRGFVLMPQLLLLVFVPLSELVFVTAVRLRKGLPAYRGSPDHFSLRLQQAGWSRWHVDVVAWLVMASAFALGIDFARWSFSGRAAVLCAVGCFGVVTARYLLRHEVERRE